MTKKTKKRKDLQKATTVRIFWEYCRFLQIQQEPVHWIGWDLGCFYAMYV
jgi:hypothetical protein